MVNTDERGSDRVRRMHLRYWHSAARRVGSAMHSARGVLLALVLVAILAVSTGCHSAAPETMPLLPQDALEHTPVTVRPPSGEVSAVAEFAFFDEQGTLLYRIEKLAARQLGRQSIVRWVEEREGKREDLP